MLKGTATCQTSDGAWPNMAGLAVCNSFGMHRMLPTYLYHLRVLQEADMEVVNQDVLLVKFLHKAIPAYTDFDSVR
jgi:hypothetical protein